MKDIEGNKLIAEFMGYKKDPNSNWWERPGSESTPKLKYHESWDWLMPVVEKIQSMRIKFIIGDTGRVKVYSKDYDWWNGSTSDRLIDCVWYAVVAFIEWQNKNKENN